ncbi:MAG: ankyrin repeat domain-containing protein [Porticoccaceae bacterium]|uniref:ankyrin repeat domain-containing protein n=1 Tax=Hydrogenophaga sp. TaxID=1904254 RepID=UPI0026318538|nr:ankyrin repeat domain-containing protein [Hydrogenophaga sp.]MDD3785111.1 ankyrin repeat domain-containing protein [Hydrogenophaga sp.]
MINMKFLKKHIVFYAFFCCMTSLFADDARILFQAAVRDDESAVVALALRGADLNSRNDKGEHALLVAIRQGSRKVADFLVRQNVVDVNAKSLVGETPLMLAAIGGDLELARRLIVHRKAEVNQPGWTALHYAASSKSPASVDMVHLLLEHHAYIDAESPNRTTPLMMAAQYGLPEVVTLLLDQGADPSLRNDKGLTAIDFARIARREADAERIAAAIRARQPAGRW